MAVDRRLSERCSQMLNTVIIAINWSNVFWEKITCMEVILRVKCQHVIILSQLLVRMIDNHWPISLQTRVPIGAADYILILGFEDEFHTSCRNFGYQQQHSSLVLHSPRWSAFINISLSWTQTLVNHCIIIEGRACNFDWVSSSSSPPSP